MLELGQFAFLAGDEDVDVIRADVAGHDLVVVQLAQGVAQVGRQALLDLFVGVAFDRCVRFHLVGQPVVHARQYAGQQQVGVGVGTGDTVFDAHPVRAVGGHA